eukprot:gene25884-32390_t
MGQPQVTGWKDLRDDQDIELLCRLLTTVGETLEIKSSSSKDKNHLVLFNAYFDRLGQVSRDKTLNSRMRFSIEEVLTLRQNGWQSRRVQEGPAKLAEIAQRVQEDENRFNNNKSAGNTPDKAHHVRSNSSDQQQQLRGGSPHQQNQQQQQSQQQQQPQSAPAVVLTETVAYKRMNGVVNEYVRNNGDMAELSLRMSECSSTEIVCLVLQIETALLQFEPFRLLVDTTMDCKLAPERFAIAISHLIKSSVLTKQYVRKIVTEIEAFNVDEGNYEAAEIRSVYERFLTALDNSASPNSGEIIDCWQQIDSFSLQFTQQSARTEKNAHKISKILRGDLSPKLALTLTRQHHLLASPPLERPLRQDEPQHQLRSD